MNLLFDKILLGEALLEIIVCEEDENYPRPNEFLEEGYCLLLNAGNITKDGFNFERTRFISKEKDESLRYCNLRRGDVVLIVKNDMGNSMGNVAFYDEDIEFENIRINSNMIILRTKENLSSQFLYYFLQSDCFKKQIHIYKHGFPFPQFIPIHSLKEMEFYFPPLDQQKDIVNFISHFDKKINLYKKINNDLEEHLKTIYNSFFEDYDNFSIGDLNECEIGLIPKQWDLSSLGEVTTEIKETVENNMELFTADNYLNLILFDRRGIRETGIKNFIVVKQNEFAFYPHRITRGIIERNDFDFDGCVNPRYVVFKVEERYENFMEMYFKSNTFYQEITKLSSELHRRQLTYDDFSKVKIAYPPKEIVNKFNNIYEDFYEIINCNESIINNLEKNKEKLIPKLISGEIDVSEINWDY